MSDEKPPTAPRIENDGAYAKAMKRNDASKAEAPQPDKKPPVVPIRVLSMRQDRPLQLPGGHPPLFAITANETTGFTVDFLPAWGVYRVTYTPRPGSSAVAWVRYVPVSWASFEAAL